jgi:hypothetical protein
MLKTLRPLALVATSSLLALIATGCAASTDESDPVGTTATSEELTSSKTVGDWRVLGGGECLAALQDFYPAKFGVSVPVAGPGAVGSCAAHGACKIWLDQIPNPAEWERIPNDGRHVPSTYDLIVYPPINGDPWGHVASVDHVEGGAIYVMDANYVAHHQKSAHPHTVSWKAYGWYHLKKLGNTEASTPAASVSCFPGGSYCGGDKVPGNPNDLFRCNAAGTGASLLRACASGCAVLPGRDDQCK